MKTEAEIGVIWPQVKECWQPRETRRDMEQSTALPTPQIQPRETNELLASRTMGE